LFHATHIIIFLVIHSANLDAIQKYGDELLTITIAGIDGTFKTVPRSPPQLT